MDDACRPLKVLLIRRDGQRVATLVLDVAAVTADVDEPDLMPFQQRVELVARGPRS